LTSCAHPDLLQENVFFIHSYESLSTSASVAGAEKEQRWKTEKWKDGLAECEEETEYLFL